MIEHNYVAHEREGWSVCTRCGMVRNYDREQTTCSGALPKIRQRSEIEDCGQDGVCKLSPGCNRHWEERNRELVRELEEARAFLRRTAMSGGSIVSSAAMTVTQIAIARAADRLLVTPDGYGFVYVPGPRFCACGRTETDCDQSRAACLDEVPASWGLLEVDGAGKVRAAKQAPRREAAPLTLGFVASLFRGLAKREAAAELRGRDRAAQELAKRPDVAELEAALQVERTALAHERRSAERWKIDLDRLAARVAAFESRTGIQIDDLALPRVEELMRFLGRGQATQLAGTMRRVADELDALSKGPSP